MLIVLLNWLLVLRILEKRATSYRHIKQIYEDNFDVLDHHRMLTILKRMMYRSLIKRYVLSGQTRWCILPKGEKVLKKSLKLLTKDLE